MNNRTCTCIIPTTEKYAPSAVISIVPRPFAVHSASVASRGVDWGAAGDFSDHADHSTRGNAVFSKVTVGIETRFGFDVEVIAAVVFDDFDRDEEDADEVASGGGRRRRGCRQSRRDYDVLMTT